MHSTKPTDLVVLHVDTEMGWRGGQNQLYLLVQGLKQKGVKVFLALAQGSEAQKRFAPDMVISVKRNPSLWDAWRVARFCREQKVGIIDAQTSKAHTLGLLVKALLPNLDLFVHRRVDYVPKGFGLKYKTKAVGKYIAISSAIGSILERLGIEKSRIEVIKSAIDPKVYLDFDKETETQRLREKFDIGPDTAVLVNASALTEQKGYPDLIQAVKLLKQRDYRIRLFIAGEGHLRSQLSAQVEELGLSDTITFLGFIDWVPSLLTGSDIFVLSSHYEGLGTIVQEAIWAGTFVCATDVGGVSEMIVDGKTGCLSPAQRPEALAERIAWAMDHPEEVARLKGAALAHLQEHFSLQRMVDGNLEAYLRLPQAR